MVRPLFYVVFLISVAMSALGIILSSRLKNRSGSECFASLLYFQVFITTFGFYGIWGQVIINEFLSTLLSAEQLIKITDLSIILGLPFLVFAWLMLLRLSAGLSGRKNTGVFVAVFLILNFLIIAVIGYVEKKPGSLNISQLIRFYFIGANLICYFIAAYLLHLPRIGRAVIHDYDRKFIAISVFIVMLLQCLPLAFFTTQWWLALLFIFAFFAGNAFLPVYLTYGTLIMVFKKEPEAEISFDDFCKKFEVSPRESDIVREICNGLSNKEISGKLFITLQTVKDHTHRIYIKTNVKSRVQLITLVKEEVGK
jgi:DNA-binding CsgD family transcriptional regulator